MLHMLIVKNAPSAYKKSGSNLTQVIRRLRLSPII